MDAQEIKNAPEEATEYVRELEGRIALLEEELNANPAPYARGWTKVMVSGTVRDANGQPRTVTFEGSQMSSISYAHAVKMALDSLRELKGVALFPYPPARENGFQGHLPANTNAPAAPTQAALHPAGGPPPAPVTTAPAGNGGSSVAGTGSGALKSITVKADGKVEFEVDGCRYALKDGRGPEAVAKLFDPSLGWQPAHFATPTVYAANQLSGLVVDWQDTQKGDKKYRDVVRIHA